ncbi:MAG: Hsp20/alpha crystallin family protein [Planctomycetaceae bacterium]|nr:Hsp20/alpha crystallin family protein [Planctomycetaceae bacterium]
MSAENPGSDGPLRNSAERLREELDRWLDVAWVQGERAMDAMGIRGRMSGPAMDVMERPDAIMIFVDVPGISSEQLDVTVSGNLLTVSGIHAAPILASDEVLVRQERPHGNFKRSIPLPATVDPESITAECTLGVLRIRVAKTEREKSRRVPVRTGESPPPVPTV